MDQCKVCLLYPSGKSLLSTPEIATVCIMMLGSALNMKQTRLFIIQKYSVAIKKTLYIIYYYFGKTLSTLPVLYYTDHEFVCASILSCAVHINKYTCIQTINPAGRSVFVYDHDRSNSSQILYEYSVPVNVLLTHNT